MSPGNKAPTQDPIDIKAIFLDGRVIAEALAEGVSMAYRRHKAFGVPAYIWQNGRVVAISPEDLPDWVEPTIPRKRGP